jgi:hypothetical protein
MLGRWLSTRAVVEIGPTPLMNGVDIVADEQPRQFPRQVAIEEHAHPVGLGCRCPQRAFREFEHRDGVFARNARELIKKDREGIGQADLSNASRNRSTTSNRSLCSRLRASAAIHSGTP